MNLNVNLGVNLPRTQVNLHELGEHCELREPVDVIFSLLSLYINNFALGFQRERSPSVAPASLGKHLAIGLETLQMFTS